MSWAIDVLRDGRAGDGVHPIVDVVFPGIHFDSVRAKDRKAGFIPYVVPAGRPKREFHRILTADRQPHIKSRCEHLRARGYEMASRSERLESFWPNLSLRPGLTDARRVLAVGKWLGKKIAGARAPCACGRATPRRRRRASSHPVVAASASRASKARDWRSTNPLGARLHTCDNRVKSA